MFGIPLNGSNNHLNHHWPWHNQGRMKPFFGPSLGAGESTNSQSANQRVFREKKILIEVFL